ncbi:hypothetical protein KME70_14625 [Ralstonia solanacearum]|nr:hypothetical protein HI812_02490 [Ralstonia solanacearum]QKL65408.1 hypothetical protein HI808_02490 [Ralstonia solanacearum]QKM41705.1 hypothetical protein HI792_02770 [Ralstonia solanacearum]QWF11187.1 hypothetical protein KME70_14625 [Ralstonia solanacearum]
MSVDVYKKYSQSPAKRAAFLERVEHYVNKCPKWTPAEGALLVNGVMPFPAGRKDIPELGGEARQLEDPDLPATLDQLRGARRVLQDYLDHVKDGDLPPGDEVLSDDFLKWCYESDQAAWNVPKLPEFLRHLFFPGTHKHPFTLSVADELASLRIMAVAADALNGQSTPHANGPSRPDPSRVIRHLANDPKRENELGPLIERAIEAAGTDKTGPVWRKLRDMALEEAAPFTGRIREEATSSGEAESDALFYHTDTMRKDGSRVDHLTKSALESRLRRRRNRLAK